MKQRTLAFAIALLLATGATQAVETQTPIKHVVVIFQENVSFDHYFATYPVAANPPGQEAVHFHAKPGTPSVNGLNEALINYNPNKAAPFRFDRGEATTCDQDHGYTDEQIAYNGGLLDKFVEVAEANGEPCDPSTVMGHYDGNTVTAYWNYAQAYAMSDNHFNSVFGPSTPGALMLTSGLKYDATPEFVDGRIAWGVIYNDLDPTFDDCSTGTTASLAGTRNVADLLNAKGVTWGWFEGGFRPTQAHTETGNGKAVCGQAHMNRVGELVNDYIPHHNPFQYWEHTSNPHHLPPSSVDMIGYTDQANHLYDIMDLDAALATGSLPEVVYIKAPAYQDGHAGYSDPLSEQTFVVQTINKLMSSPYWDEMAIFIAYDDSDGWYDHVMPPVLNHSNLGEIDQLLGNGDCGGAPREGQVPAQCGPGTRVPLLLISPFAKTNFVDSAFTETASLLRFIEYNWDLGRIGYGSFDERAPLPLNLFDFSGNRTEKMLLDPNTGTPASPLILDPVTGQPISQN
ncbi:phospholipase C [Halochromatium sp.]